MGQLFVVDDDREVVDLLVMILQQDGYQAVGFTSGERAWQAALQNPPTIIFIDLLMPHIDGVELCQKLKAEPTTKETRVVFLSGHGYLEREASAAGADDFLPKPFDLDDVLRRVARLYGRTESAARG